MAEVNIATDQASIDSRKDAERQAGIAKYWQGQLDLSEKDHKDFLEEGREVIKRYKGEKKQTVRSNQKRFNILYSNTETLKAAVFARMAKPDIRRRFGDKDPIGKQVAEILERATIDSQEAYEDGENGERAFERAIEDYLLPGRGVVRVCYEAGTAKGDDGKEYVSEQEVYDQYWPWEDFRHEPAKIWTSVTWEAFRHKMSRDDLKQNFQDLSDAEIRAVPLNWSPAPGDTKVPDAFKRAEVWEILDKTKRQRIWIVAGFDKPLRVDDDPWNLEDFFNNAPPLCAVTANDTCIPRTEFSTYQDQADGLDEIEARIDRLTKALKRRGVYDATFKELARLSKAGDNEFVPVKNYADLSTKGGLAAAFQAEDIKAIAEVLNELHTQRDLRVQTIYEVVGIADIMRGSTDPRETLGAQKIKAQFGGNRLKKRQDKVQKWIRDTLRIKAELIAEHFEPDALAQMTGFTVPSPEQMAQMKLAAQQGQEISLDGLILPEMIQVMRNDDMRCYRIDIETDSTIFEDAEAEKQAVTEMLTAVSQFIAAWEPILQAQPAMLDLAFEMLTFALRRFKMGRTFEDIVEQTKQKLEQAAQQPKQPDPKVQQEQAKAQAAAQKAQLDMQTAQQKHQMDLEKMQADLQMQREELQMMAQKLGLEREQMMLENQAKREQMAMDQQASQQQMMMDAQARQDEMAMRQDENNMNREAMQEKHQMGLETMAAKAAAAKKAANKPATK
jgi:hypothetical protein